MRDEIKKGERGRERGKASHPFEKINAGDGRGGRERECVKKGAAAALATNATCSAWRVCAPRAMTLLAREKRERKKCARAPDA